MIAFNEIDPIACATLRENFSGDVLERSIKDVRPEDVAGYERVHFFAGAGLWEIACELAGWKGPIWTASCPCQPFSVAGKGAGEGDPRHLWPDLFRLVRVCRPPVLVGEQVGGAAGDAWLDRVGADLESEGFTFWAAEAPACSVNAPHQRLRNWWAAVADADRGGHRGRAQDALGVEIGRDAAERADGSVAYDYGERRRRQPEFTGSNGAGPRSQSFWSGAEWLQCADGKARRAKPGVRLLVDGMAGRADLWRLAGNSIVPQLAAQTLIALKECFRDG